MENPIAAQGYEARLADLLNSFKAMIRRRYITLLLVSGVVFAVAIILVMLMTPKYDAIAHIRIDPSRTPLTTAQTEVLALNSEAIETEVGVLNSLELAREVVKRLKLQDDIEFSKGLDDDASRPLDEAERVNVIAGRLLRDLSVGREKLTYLLAVKFQSRDALKSARIANAFAEIYIDTRVGSRMGTAERQVSFFKRQLDSLGAEVRIADQKVAQYRAQTGIVEGGALGTIVDQQVAPLSAQLATAESGAAAARSSLAVARTQIARGGIDAVSEVRSSSVIGDMRRQRAEILRNMGEIQSRYGERHPETLKVREQLGSIDIQIKDEANRAIGSLQAEASAADARVASLRSAMRSLESEQAGNTRASVIAGSLERDAVNKRAAYDKMAQMSMESTQAARNSIAQAEIVDRAQAPTAPTSPNKPVLAAMGLIVAIALGFATITVQELLVSGLRTVADIEARFGIPVIAAVPKVANNGRSPADSLIEFPASMFAEALRNARASIIGVRSSTPPRVIALTSALPEEGKTTTALSFARILAMNGAPTLLIDCDVRRAALRSLIPQHKETGLVELLQGTVTPRDVLIPDQIEGLDIITVSKPFFSGGDLFGDDKMPKLIAQMKQAYQFIVLDLPPLMGVADARSLAALAEAVVLIVKWGDTPAPAIETSLTWLQTDESKVVGAIYTMVDPTAEAIGGMYYSGKYAAYYQKG